MFLPIQLYIERYIRFLAGLASSSEHMIIDLKHHLVGASEDRTRETTQTTHQESTAPLIRGEYIRCNAE